MPLNTGEVLIARYRVVKLLSQGGFGATYRAWALNLNRACVLKENTDISPQAQVQFEQEATNLAHLAHPGLPHVTDHFVLPGQGQYLVMDFMPGDDLGKVLGQRGPFTPEQAVNCAVQVADALDYLHRQMPPIIHRNIQPASIRMMPDGQTGLADWGSVKVRDPRLRATAGTPSLAPGYSAPEEYTPGASVDARCDVYALGATLCTLMTAEVPLESIMRTLNDTLRPPGALYSAVPLQLDQAVLRAMSLSPTQCYQTASEFKEALLAAKATAGAPVLLPTQRIDTVPPAPPPYGGTPFATRRKPFTPTPTPMPEASATPTTTGTRVPTAAASHQEISLFTHRIFLPLVTRSEGKSPRLTQAQVRATATAQARATATAQAQVLSETQECERWATGAEAGREQKFKQAEGRLTHEAANQAIPAQAASVDVRDFSAEVNFLTPYPASEGAWDYGLLFRHEAPDQEFRLVIRSDQTWQLINRIGDRSVMVQTGQATNLNTTTGGRNALKIIAQGKRGMLYLNDIIVADLDLAARMNSGDVLVATGIYADELHTGKSTQYKDFTVWSIK